MKPRILKFVLVICLICVSLTFGALNSALFIRKGLSPLGSRAFSMEELKRRINRSSEVVNQHKLRAKHLSKDLGRIELLAEYFQVGLEALFAFNNDCPKLSSKQYQLISSIKLGEYETVKQVLSTGININFTDKYGVTPLHRAVERENFDIIKVLIENGAEVNADSPYDTPLNIACWLKNKNMVSLLLKNGANIEALGFHKHTPLHAACLADSLDVVIELVESNANINSVDEIGRTPIFFAQSLEVAKYLVQAGASTNICDKFGFTLIDLAENSTVKKYFISCNKDK